VIGVVLRSDCSICRARIHLDGAHAQTLMYLKLSVPTSDDFPDAALAPFLGPYAGAHSLDRRARHTSSGDL